MDTTTDEIYKELLQLIDQYRAEVPSRRGQWPESIKTRVVVLRGRRQGLKEIAQRTRLPYYTILNWMPAELRRRGRKAALTPGVDAFVGRFLPLGLEGHSSVETGAPPATPLPATLAVTSPGYSPTATVTVTLPSGIRIEGATPEFLLAWLGALAPVSRP